MAFGQVMMSFFVLFSSLFLLGNSEQGHNVTCDVQSTVLDPGENVSVYCNFTIDVYQMDTMWITVNLFRNGPEPVVLLDCQRRSHPGNFTCTPKRDYNIKGGVNSNGILTFDILNVSAQHAGNYMCQVTPPEGIRLSSQLWPLSIRVINGTDQTDNEENTDLISILIPSLVGFVVVVVVIIVCLRKKRLCSEGRPANNRERQRFLSSHSPQQQQSSRSDEAHAVNGENIKMDPIIPKGHVKNMKKTLNLT